MEEMLDKKILRHEELGLTDEDVLKMYETMLMARRLMNVCGY